MNKSLLFLVALQIVIVIASHYNESQIEAALPEAARQGQDTFSVSMTQEFFGGAASSLTMVNGWKSRTDPNQCSVNLVHSDDGVPIEDLYGFIFELHAPARRFSIADCRKLPDRIFQPYVSG